MAKFYTGVGSRHITNWERGFIRDLAYKLRCDGWGLRSGAAEGSDDAFWQGACKYYREMQHSEEQSPIIDQIFIPWDGFNGFSSDSPWGCFHTPKSLNLEPFCMSVAKDIHPVWDKLTRGPRAMHMRNVLQVLGETGDQPSTFLIACSDPDGRSGVKGGTATAWNLARKYGVPCYNVRNDHDKAKLEKFLNN